MILLSSYPNKFNKNKSIKETVWTKALEWEGRWHILEHRQQGEGDAAR